MPNQLLNVASWYLGKKGWNVIPVGKDKVCRLPSWKQYQSQAATQGELESWWSDVCTEQFQIAIITGNVSVNLVILDIDKVTPEAQALVDKYRELTPIVRSGSGGYHLYFIGQPNQRSRNNGQGMELKANGNYVLAPPSSNLNGEYSWLNKKLITQQPIDLPEEIITFFQAKSANESLEDQIQIKDVIDGGERG